MLLKLDKLKLGKENDGRKKITDEQKVEIRELYERGIGIREITRRMVPMSRRSIQFILFPERLEHLKQHYKQIEHWKQYYDKDKMKESIRKLRAKKRMIFNIPMVRQRKNHQ